MRDQHVICMVSLLEPLAARLGGLAGLFIRETASRSLELSLYFKAGEVEAETACQHWDLTLSKTTYLWRLNLRGFILSIFFGAW